MKGWESGDKQVMLSEVWKRKINQLFQTVYYSMTKQLLLYQVSLYRQREKSVWQRSAICVQFRLHFWFLCRKNLFDQVETDITAELVCLCPQRRLFKRLPVRKTLMLVCWMCPLFIAKHDQINPWSSLFFSQEPHWQSKAKGRATFTTIYQVTYTDYI